MFHVQLLPGLPVVDALIVVCPAAAASIRSYRSEDADGVPKLLKRAFDYGGVRPRIWYVPVLLVMPVATVVAYASMRVMRLPLPLPAISWLGTLLLFVGFLVGGIAEELGWSGYATDALLRRRDALAAGLLLGLVVAAWHVIQLVQVRRPPAWIAWWTLWTVSARVIMVWLYERAGRSVLRLRCFTRP